VNRGAAGAVHLGLFRTAEEGALQYARYLRQCQQGNANCALALRPVSPDQPGTAQETISKGDGRVSVSTSSSGAGASCDAHMSPPSGAPVPLFYERDGAKSAASSAACNFVPTRGAKVWAKLGQAHWWPAVVLRSLPNGEFVMRWFHNPPQLDSILPQEAIRAFSADHNPNHEKWKKGIHFGTDFGKPKHPTKRLQLKAALKQIDEFDARGGQLSDPPSGDGTSSEESDEPDGNVGADPHVRALVSKPVYEEDAQVRHGERRD